MLDLRKYQEREVPEMIEARYGHSFLALGDFLYATGGMKDASNPSKSIECLNVTQMIAWSTILQSDSHVARKNAAAVAVSATKFAVFGGQINSG